MRGVNFALYVLSCLGRCCLGRYAAENARGGVLEANGAASIKFRDKDLLKTGE